MNKFLESLNITFRRDPSNFRPRINKLNSVKVFNYRVCLNSFSSFSSSVFLACSCMRGIRVVEKVKKNFGFFAKMPVICILFVLDLIHQIDIVQYIKFITL